MDVVDKSQLYISNKHAMVITERESWWMTCKMRAFGDNNNLEIAMVSSAYITLAINL